MFLSARHVTLPPLMAFSILQSNTPPDSSSSGQSGAGWRIRLSTLEAGTLVIALPVLVPVVVVLSALFAPTSDGWVHVRDTLLVEYVGNSLLLMLLTGVIAALVGGVSAWLTTQSPAIGHRKIDIAWSTRLRRPQPPPR